MTGRGTILRTRGLTVKAGTNLLLDHVDLDVEAGTLHGLVGPNGAGKTTLLRSVLGLVPFEGDIRLRFRRGGAAGYVPQLLSVDPSIPLTVADLFTLLLERAPVFLPRRRAARLRIQRALGETGCEALVDRLLADLSGGEMRRVLLAQALVPEPELLLLDEPASSVDEAGARLFEDVLLRQCRERGTTVLMVSHDLDFMARAAGRITALDGRVTFDGRPGDMEPGLAQRLVARGGV